MKLFNYYLMCDAPFVLEEHMEHHSFNVVMINGEKRICGDIKNNFSPQGYMPFKFLSGLEVTNVVCFECKKAYSHLQHRRVA